MKKLMFLALTALMMLNCVPAFAQDTPQDQYLCKLQAGNCLKRADVVQRRMKKLDTEIKKGKVYSADELKKIEDKLKEVEKMLDDLKAKQP
jgi:Skp family chaperone for outer membrane proteins